MSKTAQDQHPTPSGTTASPTFQAHFADGTVTRMTVFCTPQKPDLARGIKLARAAWQSRHRTDSEPPPITEARFEAQDGTIVMNLKTTELSPDFQPSSQSVHGMAHDDYAVEGLTAA
jgi:hypothetical protein